MKAVFPFISPLTRILLCSAGLGLAKELLTPDRVEADIATEALGSTLQKLQSLAVASPGNRAFGLPGYVAARDFLLDEIAALGPDVTASVQSFNHTFEQTDFLSVRGPDGIPVHAVSPRYNHATPLPDGITAPLIVVGGGNEPGCLAEMWNDIDARGKLVLVQRGGCHAGDKVKLAAKRGAVGVLLHHDAPGATILPSSLGSENVGLLVPAAVVPLKVGQKWASRISEGEEVMVTLVVDAFFDERESWNVLAETAEGDEDSVVMLGAHLDGVVAGPAINDNGSGTAGILQIMRAFAKYQGIRNKVRFAWWGAEENGLVGSRFYTDDLSEKEADRIKFYFNYDMIGSIRPEYSVYQDDRSGNTPDLLIDYLKDRGKNPKFRGFHTGSSDYVGFLERGIPCSGLSTGAGAPMDPCYHLDCDTMDNINWEAITVTTKAAGRAAAQLALSLDGVPPRGGTDYLY